jgi:hypothetical protein
MVTRTLRVIHDSQALITRRVALVLDGEQGNGGADEARQVALTELHEGLVHSPLQSVVEVVACSRGEPGRHAGVRGVSWDAHVDLATSTPELMVRAATVRRISCVAETGQHVPEQGQKAVMVQPITTKPSIDPEGGVGIVAHLSKNKGETNQHFINRTETTNRNSKINHNDKMLTQILIKTNDDLTKPC